jgi:transcriptional regulator GlxA family with amidase domain
MHETSTHTRRAHTVVTRLDAALPGWQESPLTVRELARAAGVSPRTLYRAFASHCGEPPVARLRRERLEGVRRHLLGAGPRETVTSVALDWGFAHLSRFAGHYARCFGERPSETLRRGQVLARERLTPAA